MKRFQIGLLFILLSLIANAQHSRRIHRLTNQMLLSDSVIAKAHLGISIYDIESNNYLYNYNGEHYFIPASNTKFFTLYAGMKYLGDSIKGMYYKIANDTVFVLPTADPTYLHRDFKVQPVHDFLNGCNKKVVLIDDERYPAEYGKGWTIDDIQENYMPQRSAFPACGNLLRLEWIKKTNALPDSFQYELAAMNTDVPDFSITKKTDTSLADNIIMRTPGTNHFEVVVNNKSISFTQEIPFETFGLQTGFGVLKNSLYRLASLQKTNKIDRKTFTPYYSQKSDSIFSIMMKRSDNFYAEQTLLMAANERLGYLNEQDMIDTLLHNDFADIPQKPRWVDGSGLSRYNLCTPNDLVYIIDKIQSEFGAERIQNILPTGGTGTLKNYFIADSGFIFAKTGSLSNNYTLSGILITKKNKQLIFSVMLNNYIGSSKAVRKMIEAYLHEVRERS